jgi:hypothetical protein
MLCRALACSVLVLLSSAASALEHPWDIAWAKSAELHVEIASETVETEGGVTVNLREFSYLSHVWDGADIRIAGHLAAPVSETPLPAMVLVTDGMGGAKRIAATHNVIALAIDRVGEGDSTGPTDTYDNWLDLDEGTDIRNGWMHHYVMSAVRAITYLTSLDEVQKDAIGVSGMSRGGVCSLLTSAVDDRVALCVPLAATGDMARTETYPDNWIASVFLGLGGKTNDSVAFRRFVESYDPLSYLGQFHGLVWLVNGTQDEFFPITSTVALMGGGGEKRLEAIYDGDHGHYGNDAGRFDTYDNNAAIWVRLTQCLGKAIRAGLHGGDLPETPELTVSLDGATLSAEAAIDGTDETVAVQFIYSTDGAYTFERTPMTQGEGAWRSTATVDAAQSLATFVEVEYKDDVGHYYLTSVPTLSPGFAPRIRPFAFE